MKIMAILAFLTTLIVFLRQSGLLDDWRNRNRNKKPERKPVHKPKLYDHKWKDDDD